MRAKKEYVLRWGQDNERAFPTLDKAKAFADEYVPDPHSRWYQPHPGEWYREGAGDRYSSLRHIPRIERQKVTKKTPAVGQLYLL